MERPSGPSFPIECPDKSLRGLEPAPDPFYLYLWSMTLGGRMVSFTSEDASHLGQILTRFGISSRVFRTERNKKSKKSVPYFVSYTGLTDEIEGLAADRASSPQAVPVS